MRAACLLVSCAILLSAREKLTSVQVDPPKVDLRGKWSVQHLLVTGKYSDGSVRDLTPQAKFKPSSTKIISVKGAVVSSVADGSAKLTISVSGAKKVEIPITVADSAVVPSSFLNDVAPLFGKLGCNNLACHGSQKGQGGFKLSLFGGDPDVDYESLTKTAAGRRVNRVEPEKSLVLLKASGGLPHQGGVKIKPGSAEFDILSAWLQRGAPFPGPKETRIASVKVTPEQRELRKGDKQLLLITAVFSDGSRRDVTQDEAFTAADYGEFPVVASYLRQSAVARFSVPQPVSGAFPPLATANRIDDLVYAKLKKLGIPPSGSSSDQEFLRRVFLDVIGILPTPEEARAFLEDKAPEKRAKLIDALLGRQEYADFWSLKWGDLLRIKSEYPVRVWPKAVAVYYRWVHESIAQNKPYDQFVRELLTSSGSNFRSAPCNFYRAVSAKDPRTLGETTALVFMGARLGCAR